MKKLKNKINNIFITTNTRILCVLSFSSSFQRFSNSLQFFTVLSLSSFIMAASASNTIAKQSKCFTALSKRDIKQEPYLKPEELAYCKHINSIATIAFHATNIDTMVNALKSNSATMAEVQQRVAVIDIALSTKRKGMNKAVVAHMVDEKQVRIAQLEIKGTFDTLETLVKSKQYSFEDIKFYILTRFRLFIINVRKIYRYKNLIAKFSLDKLTTDHIKEIEDQDDLDCN